MRAITILAGCNNFGEGDDRDIMAGVDLEREQMR